MKFYTKIVLDMETMQVLESESFEYSGIVDECKGDGTAKDQLKLQNQLVQQQLSWQKQFQQPVLDNLTKYLTGDIGFNPAQQSMLESQFLDQNAQNFQNAGSQVKAALAARGMAGGDLPAGGDYVRNIAELEGLKGASQASGIRDIRLQSMQQALMNKFNAANALMGNASIVGGNIGAFNQGAGNALNSYITAANQGFGNAFTSALGGTLGKAVGTAAMGGVGGMIPTQFGGTMQSSSPTMPTYPLCWIAEAIYGVDAPETHLLRYWLNHVWNQTFIGSQVLKLYRRFGQRIAKMKYVRILKPLFDMGVRRARGSSR